MADTEVLICSLIIQKNYFSTILKTISPPGMADTDYPDYFSTILKTLSPPGMADTGDQLLQQWGLFENIQVLKCPFLVL